MEYVSLCMRIVKPTLVEVAVRFVGSDLAETAVWRAAVVMNVAQPLDDRRKKPLVDVSRGEIGLSEIRLLVRVVELELERLRDLIICESIDQC